MNVEMTEKYVEGQSRDLFKILGILSFFVYCGVSGSERQRRAGSASSPACLYGGLV
jgi:hypothetical protein